MSSAPRILALAGSTRSKSFNKALVRVVAAGAEEAGVSTTLLDLKDYPLPLYDGDLEAEQGLPENAKRLKALFQEHQGLIISSPEYNSSIPGVLKNSIDWISRSEEASPDLSPFVGKVAALAAASPGGLGGLRGLVALRSILSNIGVLVLADQLTLRQAGKAFDEQGEMTNPDQEALFQGLGSTLASMVLKVHAG